MKSTTKYILGATAVVAMSAGVAGLTASYMMKPQQEQQLTFDEMFVQDENMHLASFNAADQQLVDLTGAAERSVHAVVQDRDSYRSRSFL